jgi:hypothetical protein
LDATPAALQGYSYGLAHAHDEINIRTAVGQIEQL